MQKQQSGMFRGDADELVDRLVEACANSKQTSPLANPAWIGRELQPFAFDDELPAAPAKQASSKGSQPQSPGCQLNASGSSSNNKRKGASHSPSKPRGRASLDGAAKRDVHAQASAKQRCMRQGPSQQQVPCMSRPSTAGSAAAAAPSSPIPCPQPPRAHPNAHASPSGSPPAGFACPAMFSSPKPETLPMPTSRLLMRAAYAGCGPAIALPTCAVLA